MMGSPLRIIALAALLQVSVALVEFEKSKLYDETDFAQNIVIANNFCDVGCRIYVSVPEASAEIAKKIIVKDYVQADQSLYDISKLTNNDEKGFFKVEAGILSINIKNNNIEMATAPVAVWIVRNDVDMDKRGAKVFEASALPTEPPAYGMVTIMSAEPFNLRLKTDRALSMLATLSGYDSVFYGRDDCINLILQEPFPIFPSDMQFNVHSPMISFWFSNEFKAYRITKIDFTASFEKDKVLGFSGASFAASPGYICKGQKNFRSSLYNPNTTFKYLHSIWAYDVVVSSNLTTDVAHPVIFKDVTNQIEKRLSATTPDSETYFYVKNTSNIEISWTRNEADLDHSFLISLIPADAMNFGPFNTVPKPTTAGIVPSATNTQGYDVDPYFP